MVIFDFDKTLTNKDTLFGFYSEVDGTNPLFPIKRLGLILTAVIHKVGIISNTQLKSVGVFLFLRNKNRNEILEKANEYAETIKLNSIYNDHFLREPKANRMVISGSLEIYLRPLFHGERIIGTTLSYKNDKVVGLKRNMFGKQKVEALYSDEIYNIERLYTDSYSDRFLMEISDKVEFVKKNKIIINK